MSGEPVSDDELLMRRIPPGSRWVEPPNRLTSANFKLSKKKNELGISVYRRSILDEQAVLQMPKAIPRPCETCLHVRCLLRRARLGIIYRSPEG